MHCCESLPPCHIGAEVKALSHAYRRQFSEAIRQSGAEDLSAMQGHVIAYLYYCREKDIFQRDIEEAFNITRSSVTGIVKLMEAKVFIPSHAEATDDIAPLAELNIRAVNEIADTIAELCSEPLSFETLLAELFRRYELTMTFEQHALVGSTVRSYLTWMKECGRLTAFIEDNMLLWQTK